MRGLGGSVKQTYGVGVKQYSEESLTQQSRFRFDHCFVHTNTDIKVVRRVDSFVTTTDDIGASFFTASLRKEMSMVVADVLFDEFFSRPLPPEGFVLGPRPAQFGLIDEAMNDKTELHGYAITMDGDIVVQELRPKLELKN